MAKNEADFIEYFVRHNRTILDELYIIDDKSQDNTGQILDALAAEGLVTKILQLDDKLSFAKGRQSTIMTNLMRYVTDQQVARDSFVFPLDADEIIGGTKNYICEKLSALSVDEYAIFPWKHFIPIDGGSRRRRALRHQFVPLRNEIKQFYKVAIPFELASHVTITQGNHSVTSQKLELKPKSIGSFLFHFPVRTENQIISKCLLAAHRRMLRKAPPQEAYHVVMVSDFVRRCNYRLTPENLAEAAYNYLQFNKSSWSQVTNSLLDYSFDSASYANDIIPVYEPHTVNPVCSLDTFLSDIIG